MVGADAVRQSTAIGGIAGLAYRWLLREPTALVAQRPVLLLLLLRLAEEFWRRWAIARRFRLGRLRVLNLADEIDGELIQGVLLSTEHLLTLGRVEKRTLFTRPLLEVLGGNEYLVRELMRSSQQCREKSRNCMVMRWMESDERYHVLQSSLNTASALFGSNFVHFNALDGENTNIFKSTWYCVTVMTPTRPEGRKSSKPSCHSSTQTATFTDMSRTPRASLRIVLVNESEIRRVADGKLSAPTWGFFNTRHAERFRMLNDFAKNFKMQLVRTPADARTMPSRSPFTSEKAHALVRAKPDGGPMQRVQSQPNLASSSRLQGHKSGSLTMMNQDQVSSSDSLLQKAEEAEGHGAAEDNCFLRLHVPHFVGTTTRNSSSSDPAHAAAALVASSSNNSMQDPSTLTSAGGPQSGSLARLHGSSSSGSIGRRTGSESGHRLSR